MRQDTQKEVAICLVTYIIHNMRQDTQKEVFIYLLTFA